MPVTHKLSPEAMDALHKAVANMHDAAARYGAHANVTLVPAAGDKPQPQHP